jgi:hypothetical protein
MSLTCALLATLLQQWARRYLWITQPRCNPHRRSRVRSFFAEGVDKLHLPWAVEILPTLLHGSLFLFFSGLVVFLFNIHHTVFTIVLWWVGLLTGVYICITFMPIFRRDSPYYTPLSRSMWFLATSSLYILFKFLCWHQIFNRYSSETWMRLVALKCLYLRRLLLGLVKAAEEAAQGLGSGIDGRALLWMFESLDEDHEFERFFAAIPGLCNSKVVVDPLNAFIKPNDKRLSAALIGFMDRTLSSNLISDSVKQRRVVMCRTAVDVTSLSASQQILDRALRGTWGNLFNSVDFGFSAKSWCNESNPHITFRAKCVVTHVLSRVEERDERWLRLAVDQFGVSRPVLQRLVAHGDSILLANLTFITREICSYHWNHGGWPVFYGMSLPTLEMISKFKPQRTLILPEIQRGFCDLWNQLVLTARNHKDLHYRGTTVGMLKQIRKIYIALHEVPDDTPTPFFISTDDDDDDDANLSQEPLYPLCDTHSHISILTPLDLTRPFHELFVSKTEGVTDAPATFPGPSQASQTAHFTSTTATISHFPPAVIASPSFPSILPHK